MSEIRRKLVVVGDDSCGKTCLLTVFTGGNFLEAFVPTVFQSYVADIDIDRKNVTLALWDMPLGRDEYADRLHPLSYPGSHVILICFTIDSPDSLDNVQEKWIFEVAHFCPGTPVLLVRCKQDLQSSPSVIEQLKQSNQRSVTPEEGLEVSKVIGTECYFECSARTGEGVKKVFNYAARVALLRPEKKRKTRKCLVL